MKAQIISFHCVLRNKLGQIIGSSFNRDIINQLEEGTHNLQGLVAGLQNLSAGEKRQVPVLADQAYGLYDPGLVIELKRSELLNGDRLKVGSDIQTRIEPEGEVHVFRVVQASEDLVTLDGNHPLAGQDLIFDIEVVSAREALAEDFGSAEPEQATTRLH